MTQTNLDDHRNVVAETKDHPETDRIEVVEVVEDHQMMDHLTVAQQLKRKALNGAKIQGILQENVEELHRLGKSNPKTHLIMRWNSSIINRNHHRVRLISKKESSGC